MKNLDKKKSHIITLPKGLKKTQKDSKRLKMTQNDSKWLKMTQNDSKRLYDVIVALEIGYFWKTMFF
jgi:hypothetical protein